MADISVCRGDECQIKEFCHRFTAPRAKPCQSYIEPPYREDMIYYNIPENNFESYCDMFIHNDGKEKRKDL